MLGTFGGGAGVTGSPDEVTAPQGADGPDDRSRDEGGAPGVDGDLGVPLGIPQGVEGGLDADCVVPPGAHQQIEQLPSASLTSP